MALLALPNELVTQVAQFLPTEADLSRFSRTCRRLQAPVGVVLYRRNRESNTALTWAARKNIPTIFQHAVNAGTRISESKAPLLFDAALRGHVRVLKTLLSMYKLESFVWDCMASTPLIVAIQNGHTDVVRVLLEHGADPLLPSRFDRGETPLHTVARYPREVDIAAMLVNASSDIAPRQRPDGTPLHLAARSGHVRMVEMLLDRGADYMQIENNSTPLGLAVKGGHLVTAKVLLKKSPDLKGHVVAGLPMLNAVAGECTAEMALLLLQHGASQHEGVDQGDLPLHTAASKGNAAVIRVLLDHGARVDDQCVDGKTALLHAVMSEQANAVKILLDAGANTLLMTTSGHQPLHLVSDRDGPMIVDALLDHGADMAARDAEGVSPVASAMKKGLSQVVMRLVERGADVDDKTSKLPLLSLAIDNGDLDTVSFLHSHGADLAAVDEFGCTALHVAAKNGHVDIAKFLLGHGADCQAVDSYGWTPLLLAAANGYDSVAEVLIQKGADLEQANKQQYTPLLIAAENGNLEVVEMLLASGASLQATNSSGTGPAMAAATCGHVRVLKRLLATGKVDINQRDIDNRTALLLAAMRGREAIVNVLLSQEPPPVCDTKDKWGATPLIMAARNGQASILRRLLELENQPLHEQDMFGRSALDWAARSGKAEAFALLASVAGDDARHTQLADQAEAIRFSQTSCYCDVCGRCTISAMRDRAQGCEACGWGDNVVFIICAPCADNGARCRGEGHTWEPHECGCGDGSDYEEEESDDESGEEDEDESDEESSEEEEESEHESGAESSADEATDAS